MHLAPIGAIRFARRSSNFEETVRFYRELVGLPLFETFESSYGSNGAIFGLPSWNLTMEIVAALEEVQQHPYWEATGAVTYRDPDGREVVFAPFVFGVNEPGDSSVSGKHEFPSA
jgi:hypothetical protein